MRFRGLQGASKVSNLPRLPSTLHVRHFHLLPPLHNVAATSTMLRLQVSTQQIQRFCSFLAASWRMIRRLLMPESKARRAFSLAPFRVLLQYHLALFTPPRLW